MKRIKVQEEPQSNMKNYSFSESESEKESYHQPINSRRVFQLYEHNGNSPHPPTQKPSAISNIPQNIYDKINSMSGLIPPKLTGISSSDIPKNPTKPTKSIFTHPPNFQRKTDFTPPSRIKRPTKEKQMKKSIHTKYLNPIAQLQQNVGALLIKQQNPRSLLVSIQHKGHEVKEERKEEEAKELMDEVLNQTANLELDESLPSESCLKVSASTTNGFVQYFNKSKEEERYQRCRYCKEYSLIEEMKNHMFQCRFNADEGLEEIEGSEGEINSINNLLPVKIEKEEAKKPRNPYFDEESQGTKGNQIHDKSQLPERSEIGRNLGMMSERIESLGDIQIRLSLVQ